ncbi:MAG: tetratricopeptide repeat protein, partial [Anaerolineae bacterium]
NIHALANLVHFYAVIEREDRAEGYLNRLAGLEARQADDYRKMAEAYASLERDQQVYDWLTELEKTGEELGVLDLFFLGVAAANLGKRREARHCWKRVLELDPDHEKTHRYLAALERGQPGPGWTSRYPYFSPPDLMPEAAFQEFIQMMGVKQEDRRRQGMERLVARYPQLVKVITKLLYEGEEEQVASALVELGTPEALAVVRDFAFGQVGSDEARRHAAFLLLEAGALPADQPLRLWQEGKWREVLLRRYEIVEEEPPYNPRVARRLERATQLLSQGKRGQAKKALRQLIAQHPEVKEAHHNLGAAYFQEGDLARAEESFRQALALDPDYVFARANLASICIEQDRLDEAEELLRPIPERTTFRRPELIFYQRVVAELHIVREEYDAAEAALKFILDLEPEDEAAQERLMALTLMRRSHDFFARWRERDRRRRERKRARFVVGPDTGLQECLEQLTKDALTGTRRALPRWMASNLRKAELIEAIVEALTDRTTLQEVVTGLSATEQEALAYVLAQGGLALWDEFAQRYGDDMEESPYWNWHEPQTVMGRLRLHGLLAEGTAEDQAVVLVPQELRRPLEEILKS